MAAYAAIVAAGTARKTIYFMDAWLVKSELVTAVNKPSKLPPTNTFTTATSTATSTTATTTASTTASTTTSITASTKTSPKSKNCTGPGDSANTATISRSNGKGNSAEKGGKGKGKDKGKGKGKGKDKRGDVRKLNKGNTKGGNNQTKNHHHQNQQQQQQQRNFVSPVKMPRGVGGVPRGGTERCVCAKGVVLMITAEEKEKIQR